MIRAELEKGTGQQVSVTPIVQLRGIRKSFGSLEVLRGIEPARTAERRLAQG
jgi:hypothetical protein